MVIPMKLIESTTKITITRTDYAIFMIAVMIVVSNAIHWTLAMLYSNGKMDVNALYNQSGWMIGEGWFEAGFFIITAIIGWRALWNNRPNRVI